MSDKDVKRALIIDDELSICQSLQGVLSDEGWQSHYFLTTENLRFEVEKIKPHIIFLDVWLKDADGLDVLQFLKKNFSNLTVIIMSGHGTISTAVQATKYGAFDFLEKPLSVDSIVSILETKNNEISRAKKHVSGGSREAPRWVGDSAASKTLTAYIEKIAMHDSSVLISGENGSGKEVVAKTIHFSGPRSLEPFIAINCAAIHDDQIEEELFGVSGIRRNGGLHMKEGRFELAGKGTIFFDEVGDMSAKTQAKILRVLEEQEFRNIGGQEVKKLNARVIASTNQDLKKLIESGQFRQDLFYRLNVVPISVPSLQERLDDLPQLVEYFSKVISKQKSIELKNFSAETLDIMKAYSWPGNIRELRNLIELAYLVVESKAVQPADILDFYSGISADTKKIQPDFFGLDSFKSAKSRFEREFILNKLQKYRGNISKTAEAIGIERSHLHRKIKNFKEGGQTQESIEWVKKN